MKYKIPWLPISALLFYVGTLLLWRFGIIPSPIEIVALLKEVYKAYGLIGVSIAAFLEGIVYVGLYVPGSFIILLSVLLSEGSFSTLFSISFVVAITLTITSTINYWLGRHIRFKKLDQGLFKDTKKAHKELFISTLHPNLLAFYFFDAGIEKKSPIGILYVPFIMLLVGMGYAYLIYPFRLVLIHQIETPYIMIFLISIWFVIAFLFENKRRINRE